MRPFLYPFAALDLRLVSSVFRPLVVSTKTLFSGTENKFQNSRLFIVGTSEHACRRRASRSRACATPTRRQHAPLVRSRVGAAEHVRTRARRLRASRVTARGCNASPVHPSRDHVRPRSVAWCARTVERFKTFQNVLSPLALHFMRNVSR